MKLLDDIKNNPFKILDLDPESDLKQAAESISSHEQSIYQEILNNNEYFNRSKILYPDPNININDIKKQINVQFRYIGPRPWINLIQSLSKE